MEEERGRGEKIIALVLNPKLFRSPVYHADSETKPRPVVLGLHKPQNLEVQNISENGQEKTQRYNRSSFPQLKIVLEVKLLENGKKKIMKCLKGQVSELRHFSLQP